MTTGSLPAALLAAAEGICTLEAATGLLIAHGTWLARDDFTCFINHGTGTAAVDWQAALAALDTGVLLGSGGERRMLRLAASLADQASISLGEAVTGVDDRNFDLLLRSTMRPDDASSPSVRARRARQGPYRGEISDARISSVSSTRFPPSPLRSAW
jgi:hypothetical protein